MVKHRRCVGRVFDLSVYSRVTTYMYTSEIIKMTVRFLSSTRYQHDFLVVVLSVWFLKFFIIYRSLSDLMIISCYLLKF